MFRSIKMFLFMEGKGEGEGEGWSLLAGVTGFQTVVPACLPSARPDTLEANFAGLQKQEVTLSNTRIHTYTRVRSVVRAHTKISINNLFL